MVGLELAKAYVTARGDTSRLKSDLAAARGPVESEFGKLADIMQGKIMGAIGAISAGMSMVKGLQIAGTLEQNIIAFETMMGSAEKAKAMLADLSDFAAKTPFRMGGIVQAARGLIMFGEKQDQVMETLKILGNAAAGTSSDFGMLALIFNQVRGVGRLLTQDFRQLSTRGVISLVDIAKHFGVTTQAAQAMLSTGKISFEDLRAILKSLSEEGGRFANLMEKQSTSLLGLWSTLQEELEFFLRDTMQPLVPILKVIQQWLIKGAAAARAMINPSIVRWAFALGAALAVVKTVTFAWARGLALTAAIMGVLSGPGGIVRVILAFGAAAVIMGQVNSMLEGQIDTADALGEAHVRAARKAAMSWKAAAEEARNASKEAYERGQKAGVYPTALLPAGSSGAIEYERRRVWEMYNTPIEAAERRVKILQGQVKDLQSSFWLGEPIWGGPENKEEQEKRAKADLKKQKEILEKLKKDRRELSEGAGKEMAAIFEEQEAKESSEGIIKLRGEYERLGRVLAGVTAETIKAREEEEAFLKAKGGATDQELRRFRWLQGAIRDMRDEVGRLEAEQKRAEELRLEGARITEGLMTPGEKLWETFQRLKDLRAEGAITDRTFIRALKREKEKWEVKPAWVPEGIYDPRSFAQSLQNAFLQVQDPQKELMKEEAKQTGVLQRIEQILAKNEGKAMMLVGP